MSAANGIFNSLVLSITPDVNHAALTYTYTKGVHPEPHRGRLPFLSNSDQSAVGQVLATRRLFETEIRPLATGTKFHRRCEIPISHPLTRKFHPAASKSPYFDFLILGLLEFSTLGLLMIAKCQYSNPRSQRLFHRSTEPIHLAHCCVHIRSHANP